MAVQKRTALLADGDQVGQILVAEDALLARARYGTIPTPWTLADANTITVFALWLIDEHGTD